MKRFQYFKPQSLHQAWRLKREWPELSPPVLISLRSIAELIGIEAGQTSRIGALTTISDISQHPELAQKFPLLQEAARNLGSFQIRNVATIGGNLCNCSPSADMALPLLVLEAKLKLRKLSSNCKGRRERGLFQWKNCLRDQVKHAFPLMRY